MRLNDPELVRREYADESRFAVRAAAWQSATGPDPRELAFEAVAEAVPGRVLEIGSGRGEAAERILCELGCEVVAVDQSDRMVELTRARGVEAIRADVVDLPFEPDTFDCVLAAWMLYHVSDLGRGLSEVARVLRRGGRLVAVTNSEKNLRELWGLFGDASGRIHPFNAENGAEILRRHFELVEHREARGEVTFSDWEAAHRYVSSSPTRSHLADRLPRFEGPLVATRSVAVFVAEAGA